jgi:hypothetical protein
MTSSDAPIAAEGAASDKHEVIDDAVADDAAAARRGTLGRLGLAAAIVFALFYAYALFAAISQAIDLPQAFADAGADGVPVVALVVGVLVPILLFMAALLLGIRRRIGDKVLLYVIGLAAVAALSFTLLGIENAALAAALP